MEASQRDDYKELTRSIRSGSQVPFEILRKFLHLAHINMVPILTYQTKKFIFYELKIQWANLQKKKIYCGYQIFDHVPNVWVSHFDSGIFSFNRVALRTAYKANFMRMCFKMQFNSIWRRRLLWEGDWLSRTGFYFNF